MTVNSAGTTITIQNVRVETDSCPIFDVDAGATTCGAEAGLVPATQTCPWQGAGMIHLWSAQRAATGIGRTMNSGPVLKVVPTAGQYRVCAYLARESANFGESIIFVAEALSPVSPSPTADEPPVEQPGESKRPPSSDEPRQQPLSTSKAKASAKAALANKLGKRWHKGSKRRLSCLRRSSTKIRCKATWRYDGKARKASVVVTKTAAGTRAKLL